MIVAPVYLRAWRMQKGLGQDRLAEAGRLSQSAISRIESGAVIPSIPTLLRLTKALDISLAEILVPPQNTAGGLPRFAADRIAKGIVSGKYPAKPSEAKVCRDFALLIGEKLKAQAVPGWKRISRQRLHSRRRALWMKKTYSKALIQQIHWRVDKELAGGTYAAQGH